METHKTCCFIGHRKIEITEKLMLLARHILEIMIKDKGVSTFAFGSRSEFDDLCYDIVTDLKNDYSTIKRVFLTCRNETCVLERERKKFEQIYSNILKREVHLKGFEKEIEHKTKYNSGRAAYIERNQALIDMSDFCVFYFDKDYLPPKRKVTKGSLLSYQPKSGTSLAYNYAKQKNKPIINMFSIIENEKKI